MSRSLRFCILLFAILLTAHRSPAPIVEQPENPTPAAQEHAPKAKRSPKSKPEQSESAEPTQTRKSATKSSPARAHSKFAGNWVGTMPTIPWGNLPSVVTIDSTETAMAMSWYEAEDGATGKIHQQFKPSPESARAHPSAAYASARRDGDTITASYPAPLLGKSTWSLTPNPDGVTAKVRMQAFMNDFSATFRRSP